jgi:two-component system, OmpR family, response regulator ResD
MGMKTEMKWRRRFFADFVSSGKREGREPDRWQRKVKGPLKPEMVSVEQTAAEWHGFAHPSVSTSYFLKRIQEPGRLEATGTGRNGEIEMREFLVIEDEQKIRDVIVSYLQNEGFTVWEAATGTEGLRLFAGKAIDFVILDLMLPDVPGETLCQQIREQSPVPIIMLTAKVGEEDRIKGLALGADDYVIKPFSPRELIARVKAILRRSGPDLLATRVTFNGGDLVIDSGAQTVWKQGKTVHLTPAEYKLLSVMARHPGRPFSREELVIKAFGYDYHGDDRTIDQHVKNLRHKIESDPRTPEYIQTVYGFGYRFAPRERSR